jgi:hypothetical protein
MTEYTFEIKGIVIVKLQGSDTEENYSKAKSIALTRVIKEIDGDWIVDVTAEEYGDGTEEIYA